MFFKNLEKFWTIVLIITILLYLNFFCYHFMPIIPQCVFNLQLQSLELFILWPYHSCIIHLDFFLLLIFYTLVLFMFSTFYFNLVFLIYFLHYLFLFVLFSSSLHFFWKCLVAAMLSQHHMPTYEKIAS